MTYAAPVRVLIVALAGMVVLAPLRADGVDAVVERFLARTDDPLTAYRGERRLHARNERFGVEGWLDAEVRLTPGDGFTYSVLREGGSAYIRNKVLRRALQGEQELVAQGTVQRASLTPENYAFVPAAEEPAEGAEGLIDTAEGPRSSVERVGLRPLRKDILLVDGVMTLDGYGDLLSVEGRLSKNPSFWTTRVQVIRRYGRVAGVRVPTSLESIASVRIAGKSRMTVDYGYGEINGRAVSVEERVTLDPLIESPE